MAARAVAIGTDHDTGAQKTVETNVADETDVDNPTGFSPLGAVGPLAIAQATGGTMKSAPGRMTGRMCLRITFAERPNRPARFCNRYVSSGIFDPFLGPLGNPIAFNAAMDASGAFGQQGAGESAGTGTGFDNGGVAQIAGGPRNPRGEVEVEQEVLAERFLGAQIVPPDDLAQRRQVVDLRH